MKNNKIDLTKLKEEIERKSNENVSKVGGNKPRHSFLSGLLESLETGKDNNSTITMKAIDNLVSEKKGEKPIFNNINNIPPPQPLPQINEFDRDDQFYEDLNKKNRKTTLAESMEQYINKPIINNQNKQNPNQLLVENVKTIVDNHLADNFGLILEDGIKSTIIEMYAVERIKKALDENRELIKNVVIETIREIQQKNKSKNS